VRAIYACGEILEMDTNLTAIRLNFFVGVLMLFAFTINYVGKMIGALSTKEQNVIWAEILYLVSTIGFVISFLILIYVFRGFVRQS